MGLLERIDRDSGKIISVWAVYAGISLSLAGVVPLMGAEFPFNNHGAVAIVFILLTISVLLFIILICARIVRVLKNRSIVSQVYIVRNAEESDLWPMQKFGEKILGQPLGGVDVLKVFMSANRNSIRLMRVERRHRNGDIINRIAGYYIVIPLKKITFERWCSGKISSHDLIASDICSSDEAPYAIYIDVVVSHRGYPGGLLLSNLAHHIGEKYLDSAEFIFARAASDDGHRLIKWSAMHLDPRTKGKLGDLYFINLREERERVLKIIESVPRI